MKKKKKDHYNLRSSVFGCPEDGTIFGSEAEDRQLSRPKTVAEAEPLTITTFNRSRI